MTTALKLVVLAVAGLVLIPAVLLAMALLPLVDIGALETLP